MSKKTCEIPYDMEQMLVSALRYALGRRTYIVEITNDCIQSRITALSTITLTVMQRDLSDFVDTAAKKELSGRGNSLFGSEVNKQWEELLGAIEVELWERGAINQFVLSGDALAGEKMYNALNKHTNEKVDENEHLYNR